MSLTVITCRMSLTRYLVLEMLQTFRSQPCSLTVNCDFAKIKWLYASKSDNWSFLKKSFIYWTIHCNKWMEISCNTCIKIEMCEKWPKILFCDLNCVVYPGQKLSFCHFDYYYVHHKISVAYMPSSAGICSLNSPLRFANEILSFQTECNSLLFSFQPLFFVKSVS